MSDDLVTVVRPENRLKVPVVWVNVNLTKHLGDVCHENELMRSCPHKYVRDVSL